MKRKGYLDFTEQVNLGTVKVTEVDGVWELGIEKLNPLIKLKYGTASVAKEELGEAKEIRQLFTNFQQYLYQSA